MMRTSLKATAVAIGACALLVPLAPAAQAADTTVTFTLVTGAISITASPATVLTQAVGASVATGTVTPVAVTDARLGVSPWTATALISDFTGAVTIPKAKVTYTGTVPVKVGTATIVTAGPVTLDGTKTVQNATSTSGLNTATWSGGLSVDISAGVTTGLYTATLTHSVA